MTSLIEQIQEAKNKLADQTEEKAEYSYEPPAAGPCVARLVSYVEIGKHPQRPYQGKEKPPAHEAIVEFELLGKKHRKEIEVDGEKKVVHPIIRERITIKQGARAGFFKLLKAMDYGRGNTHMAFMLGEGFILKVVHNEVEKDGQKRVYANIKDESGNWLVQAPVRVDEEGEAQPLNVPEPTVNLRLLLQASPTVEQWDSIFIPGTVTRKENGQEIEVSKNWLQNLCKEALDYEGSALHQVVVQREGDLPDPRGEPQSGSESAELSEGSEDTGESEKALSGEHSGSPGGSDDDDPLADLGLD